MSRLKLLTSAALILWLIGCNQERSPSAGGLPIVVHPTLSTRVRETQFEAGDRIGLNITFETGKPHAENEALIHNGEHFVSQDLKWYESGESSIFRAYHPYMEDYDEYFTIETDQSGEGYHKADILIATATNVTPLASGVSLLFNRAMAQVVITVENNSGVGVSSVSVGNVKGFMAIDLEKEKVSCTVTSPVVNITANKLSEQQYRVVFAPQEISLSVTIMSTTGATVTKTFSKTNFYAGRSYRATVTVDDDFDITEAEIVTDSQIQGWAEGTELQES